MNFAVIIPTYNRRKVLAAAIDSALSQQGLSGGVEVIVVDDASTDDTVTWLAEAYQGQAVCVLANQGRKGPAGGRNTGLKAAAGRAVAFLDSDDRFLPGHLAATERVFEAHQGVGVVFGAARYLRAGVEVDYMGPNFRRKLLKAPKAHDDETLAVFDGGFFDHLLAQGCWFNLSSVVLRAEAATQFMCEDLRVAEDYEYWVRLARSHGFACLKQAQIEYTLGDDNISFESDAAAEGHAIQLLRAYGHMLSYPGLTRAQRQVLRTHVADTLFDWGYRERMAGRRLQAALRHAQSLTHGRRAQNAVALLKALLLPAPARQSGAESHP